MPFKHLVDHAPCELGAAAAVVLGIHQSILLSQAAWMNNLILMLCFCACGE